ncbi:MAG: formate dehydrogenase accessory sulfurtransferase FdhD [Salaquimonas sp.]|nr:formate dehydrogenase accessory sulfurtransferase FdhD [Salaquimonas sp.]
MATHRTFHGLAHRAGSLSASSRVLAEEVPVAISFNGTSHAVLMATPSDLGDLARGFTLSEGIVSSLDEIEDIAVVEEKRGIDVQVRVVADVAEKLQQRRRSMAGPVGCGLCGIESIEAAMRDIPMASAQARFSSRNIAEAAEALAEAQKLNHRTHSVHGAGFYTSESGIVAIREDVGRHNALDKLVGAMAADRQDMGEGAIVLTSRLSVELVQKAAVAGCGILVAVSAPTALAVETANKANITLVAVVRGHEFEVFSHPQRIAGGTIKHVA